MKLITLIFTCIICLFGLNAKAQPIVGNGCMTTTNPNRVYQTYLGTYNNKPAYKGYAAQYSEWTTQYDITDYPCFKWTQTSANGCYIKMSSSSSSYQLGNYGNFTGFSGTACPLDDYILPMGIAIAGLAFYYIRKQQSITS